MNRIVYFLKNRRKEKGLTQESVAKMMGNKTARYYQTIESGSIRLDELIDLSKILGFRIQIITEENILTEV